MKKLLEEDVHQMFVKSKKNNKMDSFFDSVGQNFSLVGSKIRDLLKNIGKDYRAINQKLRISGEETEEKEIRGSSEIYELIQLYHDLSKRFSSAAKCSCQ